MSNRGPGNRSNRGPGNKSNRSYGTRTMHKATCADCGNECEVPFKPAEGRDVYCRECYKKHKKY